MNGKDGAELPTAYLVDPDDFSSTLNMLSFAVMKMCAFCKANYIKRGEEVTNSAGGDHRIKLDDLATRPFGDAVRVSLPGQHWHKLERHPDCRQDAPSQVVHEDLPNTNHEKDSVSSE